MANLTPIVAIINETLRTTVLKDKRFMKAKLFEIARVMPVKKGEIFELVPGIINENGEITKVYPDDKNVIQVYHKINSSSVSVDKAQYGNGNTRLVRTANMSMIIFGLRSTIKRTEDEMDLFISASLPSKLTKQQLIDNELKDCSINHTNTDFNSLQIYSREYNSKQYYLNSSHLFFEMKYTIECKFDKSCINTCEC